MSDGPSFDHPTDQMSWKRLRFKDAAYLNIQSIKTPPVAVFTAYLLVIACDNLWFWSKGGGTRFLGYQAAYKYGTSKRTGIGRRII